MTEVHVIGSNSSANGYILVSKGEALFVELGCKVNEYYDAIISDERIIISGCIVSHVHSDHFNHSTVKKMVRRGVDIYVGENVYDTNVIEFSIMGILWLKNREKTHIGGFIIQPFEVSHNVPNYGFLIETPTKERVVFVTDAIECKYHFKNINCIMVECNHDNETMLDNLDRHEVGMSHPENHLGLSDCISFCKVNASAVTKQIILTHLSHQNINEEYARMSVQKAVPEVPVSVAHKGNVFNIENDNF